MKRVNVDGNKYIVIIPETTEDYEKESFRCLRYDEEWQDLTGNNLVYCLAVELDEERKKNKQLEEIIDKATKAVEDIERIVDKRIYNK